MRRPSGDARSGAPLPRAGRPVAFGARVGVLAVRKRQGAGATLGAQEAAAAVVNFTDAGRRERALVVGVRRRIASAGRLERVVGGGVGKLVVCWGIASERRK